MSLLAKIQFLSIFPEIQTAGKIFNLRLQKTSTYKLFFKIYKKATLTGRNFLCSHEHE